MDNGDLLKDIHEKVIEVHADMRVMKEKVCGETGLVYRSKDHETRIRSVEKKVWYATGAAAIIGFISSKISGLWK